MARDAVHLLTTPLDAGVDHPGRDLLWHTILAARPTDPALPDPAWRAIAQRLMAETGLDPDGRREAAVPWLAVRHGPNQAGADHLHIVALLLRPDGTPASTNDDVFAAQRAARWAEHTCPSRHVRATDDAHGSGSGQPSRRAWR